MGEVKPGRLLFLIFVAVCVVLPLRRFVAEPIFIPTASMEPTLRVGVHLFCDKLTFRFRPPRRGDILVLTAPDGEPMVKRLIGLPGETVELREKAVWIDGKPVDEPYAVHGRAGERLEGDSQGPWPVPPRHYFVLGDNRDESNDSSVWKDKDGVRAPFLPLSSIQGLVRGIY